MRYRVELLKSRNCLLDDQLIIKAKKGLFIGFEIVIECLLYDNNLLDILLMLVIKNTYL